MIKITIDTNVIGKALKPQSVFRKSVESRIILAFIAEISLTLDGLSKSNKINLLALKSIGHSFNQSRWDDFMNIGVRFLLCPRIGLPRPIGKDSAGNEFKYTLFYKSPEHTYRQDERLYRYFDVLKYIQDELNTGQEWLKDLSCDKQKSGAHYDEQESWFINLIKNIESIGKDKILKRFGDWADADAIAAHYAYGNDYFFTDDKASGTGSHSVLSFENRNKLKDKFNIKFVSSEEIEHILKKKLS